MWCAISVTFLNPILLCLICQRYRKSYTKLGLCLAEACGCSDSSVTDTTVGKTSEGGRGLWRCCLLMKVYHARYSRALNVHILTHSCTEFGLPHKIIQRTHEIPRTKWRHKGGGVHLATYWVPNEEKRTIVKPSIFQDMLRHRFLKAGHLFWSASFQGISFKEGAKLA